MWSRDATVGDLRRVHEESKGKPYVSSLDWITGGAFVDRGQPDDTPLAGSSDHTIPVRGHHDFGPLLPPDADLCPCRRDGVDSNFFGDTDGGGMV
jgi:hypothetical protein